MVRDVYYFNCHQILFYTLYQICYQIEDWWHDRRLHITFLTKFLKLIVVVEERWTLRKALEWRPEGRRRPDRHKATWQRMAYDERTTAGWQSWQLSECKQQTRLAGRQIPLMMMQAGVWRDPLWRPLPGKFHPPEPIILVPCIPIILHSSKQQVIILSWKSHAASKNRELCKSTVKTSME